LVNEAQVALRNCHKVVAAMALARYRNCMTGAGDGLVQVTQEAAAEASICMEDFGRIPIKAF
jgi:hypothetical protein